MNDPIAPRNLPAAAPCPLIFASRWLQLPLYLGLIAAQAVYVVHFWVELEHLLEAAFRQPDRAAGAGHQHRLQGTTCRSRSLNETVIMLVVLALIDVVMISNLLIMVIVGGYETFVSRMNLEGHPRPARMAEPCERVGAQGEAGDRHHRHQLHPPAQDLHQRGQLHRPVLIAQTVIHITFLLSAMAIAYTDKLMSGKTNHH
jgi:uncharacterized membrane protein YqhA